MKAFNIVFIISVIILSSVALAAVGDITFCPDINGDGTVNDPDISILQAAYGQSNCPPYDCDIDNDGTVAISDILDVSVYYGNAASSFPACSSGQPDLIINSITTGGSLTSGSSIWFTASVQNIGGMGITNVFGTSFRIDLNSNSFNTENVFLGAPPTEGSQLPLATGATTTEQSDAWTTVAGTHTLRVCSDWLNQVSEANENNNCRDYTFTVTTTSG